MSWPKQPKPAVTALKQDAAASNTSAAGQSIASGAYTSSGGTLRITGRVGGYVTSGGSLSFVLKIGSTTVYTFTQFVGLTNQHMSFPFDAVASGVAAGAHTVTIENNGGTFNTDGNDRVDLVITEIP